MIGSSSAILLHFTVWKVIKHETMQLVTEKPQHDKRHCHEYSTLMDNLYR